MPNRLLPATRAGAPGALGYPIEQAIEYLYDHETGAQTLRRWKGGSYAACLNLSAALQQSGWNTRLFNIAGPDWGVEAKIGYSWNNTTSLDTPVDKWELSSNKSSVEILHSQTALIAALNKQDIYLINNHLKNPPPANPSGAPPDPPVAADGTPLTDAGMVVFELILAGVNAQELFQPTLKHTQYVSSSYAVQTSYENVSKILASSTVAALLPQNIAFILPPDPQFGMIGFAYGWYKDLPQVTGAAFSKTQIVTNYEFGLWNVAQYNTPI